MKKTLFSSQFAVLIFLFMQGIVFKAKSQDATNLLAKTDQQFFIENKGQWPNEVLYLTKQNGLNAWITKTGVVYDFYEVQFEEKTGEDAILKIPNSQQYAKEIKGIIGHVVGMTLHNSLTSVQSEGKQKSQAYHNYMIGNDQSKWASNVGLYKEANLENIYQDIDERFYFENGSIRYDYIVKPNGNPSDINLKIEGATTTTINSDGELVFTTRFGEVKQAELYTYQIINGTKTTVTSSFKQLQNGSIGFEIGAYDNSVDLVIDPILWSAFVGGQVDDYIYDLDVDINHKSYVCGYTLSNDLPNTFGSYQPSITNTNFTEAFVSKLDQYGNLVFSTYLGGNNLDEAVSIKINNFWEIVVVGQTKSTNFDLQGKGSNPVFQTTNAGLYDLFYTILNPNGTSLLLSSYLGGNSDDKLTVQANGISGNVLAVDLSGNMYITGHTKSSNYPVTAGFSNANQGADAIVTKINYQTGLLTTSRIFGGNGTDIATAIALDANNNIIITGGTSSNTTFPITANAYQSTLSNGTNALPNSDAFLVKLLPSFAINYCSYFGRSADEIGNAIAINNTGEFFITGYNYVNIVANPFTPYPTTAGSYDPTFNISFTNALNTFISKIDITLAGTNQLVASTFLAPFANPGDIGIDDNNDINLTGYSSSIFPTTSICPIKQTSSGAMFDVFYSKLDNNLTQLKYSTFIGGLASVPISSWIWGTSLSLYHSITSIPDLNVYIAGYTEDASFPHTNGGPMSSLDPSSGFVTRITTKCLELEIIAVGAELPCGLQELNAATNEYGTFNYSWVGPNSFAATTANITAAQITSFGPGVYTCTVTDVNGNSVSASYTILPPIISVAATANPIFLNQCGQSTVLTATPNPLAGNGVTYLWTGSTGCGLPTAGVSGVTITVTPTQSCTYYVTATDQFGCTKTSSVAVYLSFNSVFCCNQTLQNDQTVNKIDGGVFNSNNPSYNAIIVAGAPTITGKKFYINGNLSIQNNVTFKNCQFFFTANSKIVVNPNVILTLSDNAPTFPTLQSAPGCDMWDGIYADDNTEQIIISNALLCDMINGVVLKNGAKASIVANSFTNNRIAMQLENMPFTPSIAIKNNTITAPTLIAPYLAQIGEHGIKITNCPNITIGGNSNEKNHFENLYNGIYISQQYSANVASTITTSYNTFKNITGGQTILPGYIQPWPPIAFNAQHRGNAIYGYNNNANYTSNLIHFGNNNSTINDFENCQRAAVVTSFTTDIENSYVDNGEAGFMHYTCENQVQIAINNHIDNVYLGILANGNSHGGFHYNVVNLLQAPSGTLPWFQYVSKGIDLNYYISNVNAGSVGSYMQVTNNTITTNANDFAWGVNFNNVSHTHANYNTITFNGGASNTTGLPTLRGMNIGIGNALNAHLDFKGNKFKGSYSASNLNTRSTGIFINRTTNANITCNEFNNLREGMNVVGNCQIDVIYNTSTGDGFKGNWFNTSSATTTQMSLGILFRNLASGGSLGNIGSASADNHNTFGPASAYSFMSGGQNKKLFSMCAGNLNNNRFIFTNPFVLNNNEVGSTLSSCGYFSQPNNFTHYEYHCSNSSYVAVNGFPVAQALDIATDQVPYAEFNEVAEWMDEHALYEQLSEDETLMQNNAILQQFYNDHQNDPTHYIVRENEHIRDLLSGMNGMTLADYQTALDNAETNNALIISTEQYEINERLINDIYITYLRTGAGSFTESEWQTISDLATQCPYIGGSAVLKARNLYTLINPLVGFEDVTLCNSVGVYKNGDNTFNNENNMLDSMSAAGALLVDANRLKIYPNPANSEINITYNTQVESQFIIYDITGRAIVETKLPAKNAKVSVDISRISNGVYTYKQSIGERVVNTGKFVKSDN